MMNEEFAIWYGITWMAQIDLVDSITSIELYSSHSAYGSVLYARYMNLKKNIHLQNFVSQTSSTVDIFFFCICIFM